MSIALHAPIRADFTETVRVDTNNLDWQPSPSPNVVRKRLDLAGEAEASRVTSIVRYAPRSPRVPQARPPSH